MAENTVQRLVRKAWEAHIKGSRMGFGPARVNLNFDERVVQQSIGRAMSLLGFGLGLLTLAFDDCWVTDSPLFNMVGGIVCLLFLLLCWATGVLWWILTASGKVCDWASDLFWFGAQPYRASAGIAAVFIVAVPLCQQLLEICGRQPWLERYWQNFLVLLRWLLWLLAIGVWLVALWQNTATLLKTTAISEETAEYSVVLSWNHVVQAVNNKRAKRFWSESPAILHTDLVHHESQLSCVGCIVPSSHDGDVIDRITDSKLT